MSTALIVVNTEKMDKQPAERVSLLEMRPKDDWFACVLNERGRKVWYLRFSVTGMVPRLYGPFISKRKAVLFLDSALDTILECTQEIDDSAKKYGTTKEFERLNWGPLIEHPVLSQIHPK